MTHLIKLKGATYHWVLDLFRRKGLLTVDGIEEVTAKDNERMRRLENQQIDKAKQKRVAFKQERPQEQKKRYFSELQGYHAYYIGHQSDLFTGPTMLIFHLSGCRYSNCLG